MDRNGIIFINYTKMGLSNKVALVFLVFIVIQITCRHCMPRSMKKSFLRKSFHNNNIKSQLDLGLRCSSMRNYERPKYIPVCNRYTQKKQDVNVQPLFTPFHFSETEYPLISNNFANVNDLKSIHPLCKSCYCAKKQTNAKINLENKEKVKRNCGTSDKITTHIPVKNDFTDLFTPEPQPYCLNADIIFPEIQYPTNVMDLLKRNYWNQLPGQLDRQIHFDLSDTCTPNKNSNYMKPENKASKKAIQALIKSQESMKLASLNNSDVCPIQPETMCLKTESNITESKINGRTAKSKETEVELSIPQVSNVEAGSNVEQNNPFPVSHQEVNTYTTPDCYSTVTSEAKIGDSSVLNTKTPKSKDMKTEPVNSKAHVTTSNIQVGVSLKSPIGLVISDPDPIVDVPMSTVTKDNFFRKITINETISNTAVDVVNTNAVVDAVTSDDLITTDTSNVPKDGVMDEVKDTVTSYTPSKKITSTFPLDAVTSNDTASMDAVTSFIPIFTMNSNALLDKVTLNNFTHIDSLCLPSNTTKVIVSSDDSSELLTNSLIDLKKLNTSIDAVTSDGSMGTMTSDARCPNAVSSETPMDMKVSDLPTDGIILKLLIDTRSLKSPTDTIILDDLKNTVTSNGTLEVGTLDALSRAVILDTPIFFVTSDDVINVINANTPKQMIVPDPDKDSATSETPTDTVTLDNTIDAVTLDTPTEITQFPINAKTFYSDKVISDSPKDTLKSYIAVKAIPSDNLTETESSDNTVDAASLDIPMDAVTHVAPIYRDSTGNFINTNTPLDTGYSNTSSDTVTIDTPVDAVTTDLIIDTVTSVSSKDEEMVEEILLHTPLEAVSSDTLKDDAFTKYDVLNYNEINKIDDFLNAYEETTISPFDDTGFLPESLYVDKFFHSPIISFDDNDANLFELANKTSMLCPEDTDYVIVL